MPTPWNAHRLSRVSKSCWNALKGHAASHGGLILPNLRELIWTEDKELQFATIFLQPSLRSLEFLNGWAPNKAMMLVLRALKDRGSSFSQLKRFVMDHQPGVESDYSPPVLDLLSSALCTLNHLVKVDVNAPLSEDALVHLASLSSLTSLSLCIPPTNYTRSSLAQMTGPKFTALTHLYISTSAMDAEPASSFLDAITPPRLEHFEIFLAEFYAEVIDGADLQPDNNHLKWLFITLGKISTLTSIAIKPWSCKHVDPEFIIEEGTLSPLFALKNIRYLDMARSPTKLSATLLARIAETWPEARSLSLGAECGHVGRALGIAVEDLLPLAIHCRNLHHLALNITHSRQTDLATFDHLLPTPQSALTSLQVHGSHLAGDDDGFIALFLAYAFPKVDVRALPSSETLKARFSRLNKLKDRVAILLEGRGRPVNMAVNSEG